MNNLIVNGVPWFDDQGRLINSHGPGLVREGERWYLFGSAKEEGSTASFDGITCYSSTDLVNWHFERVVLPAQEDPKFEGMLSARGGTGDRPKVLRCPATGKYVMLIDTAGHQSMGACTAIAVCDTVDGDYELLGPLLYQGKPIHRWDIGSFQDDDGTGYLLAHEGDIYRLSEDYLTAEELVAENVAEGGEAPAMLHWGDLYYFILSNKTGWESNDDYYLTAPSPAGPWTKRGLLAPEGTCTWDSQSSFVITVDTDNGPMPVYVADRWSCPHHGDASTMVWLPLKVDGESLTLPGEYWDAWDPATGLPGEIPGRDVEVTFRSDAAGTYVDIPFEGTGIALFGDMMLEGGYGLVQVFNEQTGAQVCGGLVTYRSPAALPGTARYVTPDLPRGRYRAHLTVTGEMSVYFTKNGTRWGSTGTFVSLTSAKVR